METYRHALFRYSTGAGFNANINVPKKPHDVASYQGDPLIARQIKPTSNVNIKREADRVSMQVEAAYQQIRVLGYDSELGKKLRKLKSQVAVLNHLMTNYPIEFINKQDLEQLYTQYSRNSVGMDNVIKKVVKYNNKAKGIDEYVKTAAGVRKGYPLYDQFGKKLASKEQIEFANSQAKTAPGLAGLAGFGEESGPNLVKIVAILLLGAALLKMFKT
jgi:hypothetical protein